MVGIQSENDVIKLNAGPTYILQKSDICFYMSINKEENSSLLIAESAQIKIPDEDLNLNGNLNKRMSIANRRNSVVPNSKNNTKQKNSVESEAMLKNSSSFIFLY